MLEVVVSLALSLLVVTLFGLSVGHAFYALRYQRDRLTALCCARSALNHCLINRAGSGAFYESYGKFSTVVSCQADNKYTRLLFCTSTASWPSGSVVVRSGVVQ